MKENSRFDNLRNSETEIATTRLTEETTQRKHKLVAVGAITVGGMFVIALGAWLTHEPQVFFAAIILACIDFFIFMAD